MYRWLPRIWGVIDFTLKVLLVWYRVVTQRNILLRFLFTYNENTIFFLISYIEIFYWFPLISYWIIKGKLPHQQQQKTEECLSADDDVLLSIGIIDKSKPDQNQN
jgi:hypothetical protein